MIRLTTIVFCLSTVWCCRPSYSDVVEEALANTLDEIDFNFHVKPILADRCFKCHGPDANQRKGDLRLDLEESAHKFTTNEDSQERSIIEPGKPQRSEVVRRILSAVPSYQMPPSDSHLEVSTEEKAILVKWIEQGAKYKPHWSFIKSAQVDPPVEGECQQSPIDCFIADKLRNNGFSLSAEAEKSVLLRRLALDLTGLPPSVEEIELFLKDDSVDAYERVVDRLLASPHYGERLTLEWLDLARYADSHGYQDDGMRNTWPWRDWVIDAYNRDMPFDTFLLWQLAGDMLPNATAEQRLATCFNRNHPQSQEGGVVDEEYRIEYVADRTNTLGKAILGLTVECARCHDHKYDPISQEDYYSLFAYFNNINDAGTAPYNGEASPTIILPEEEAGERLRKLRSEIADLEEQIMPTHYQEEFEAWAETLPDHQEDKSLQENLVADFEFERETSISSNALYLDKLPKPKPKPGQKPSPSFAYFNKAKNKLDAMVWGHPDDRPELVSGKRGQGLQFVGDAGVRFNRDLDFDRHQPFSVGLWIKVTTKGLEGPIFGKTNGDFEGYRGWLCKINKDGTLSFQFNHTWPGNCIDFQTKEPIAVHKWVHIALTYDGSSQASGVRFYLDGIQPEAILYTDNLKKSILHGVRGTNWSNQPFILGMELRKSIENMIVDGLKIYDRELSGAEIRALIQDKSGVSYGDIEPGDRLEYYLLSKKNKRYDLELQKLTQLRKEENLLVSDQPEVMVMQERKHRRPTYILDRGAYDAPAAKVKPAVPRLLQVAGLDVGEDRLSLAHWTIHPDNPLTTRVAVNRLWQMCFGRGLVATQEDFGNQGNLPSHPALLDWLSHRFIELGWSTKKLLKEIVMSATYKQSSKINLAALEIDPQNMLYTYFPATRLNAESIRDQALAASGLLSKKIGGPSVYPYQPVGIWKALATRNATEYVQQHGENLYRRSMYTIWKRSSPPPAMLNFDAPDRYYCVVRRQQTATPLQSFVLMNDPQFVEAARVLAQDVLVDNPLLDELLKELVQRLLGRLPRAGELETLTNLYDISLERFGRNLQDARAIIEVGEFPLPSNVDRVKLAATSIVVSALMNHDEFVTKR